MSRTRSLSIVAVALLAAGTAAGETPLAEPETPAAEPEAEAAAEAEIELGGRVFVRDSAVKIANTLADWRNELVIASARVVANYRIGKLLKAQVEVELADTTVELKDAYIRYRPIPELRLQVGRFKRPISPVSMEGAWNLPMVERGVLNDGVSAGALDIRFPFGGRSDGGNVELRPQLPLSPRLSVGVFTSSLAESNIDGVDAFDESTHLFEDVFGRASVEVIEDLRVGATVAAYQRVRNDAGDVNHAGVASVDVTYKHPYGRAWLEGFYGRTPYVDPAVGRVRGAMWAGRLIVAGRVDRMIDLPVTRLEPFVSLAALEPSTTLRESRAIQAGGGVSVNVIKELKAQIEYVRVDTELQFPVASLHRVFFQVGSKF